MRSLPLIAILVVAIASPKIIAKSTFTKPVPAVAYLNANMTSTTLTAAYSQTLTEFDIRPIVRGEGLRIAYANWSIGNEYWNPFPVGSPWYGQTKYPGFQESRTPGNPVLVEFAILRSDGKWEALKFGGQNKGVVANGGHIWSDWINSGVRPGFPIRARLKLSVAIPGKEKILASGGYAYDWPNRKAYVGATAPDILTPNFKGNINKPVNGENTSNGAYCFPAIIQTKTNNLALKPMLAIGDSVLRAGTDQGSLANPTGWFSPGYIGRGFAKLGIPVVSFGVSGDRAEMNKPEWMPRRWALMKESGCTSAIINFGVNDSASDSSSGSGKVQGQEILDRNVYLANGLSQIGMSRIFLTTILPNTTSDAAYANKQSQTVKTNGYATPNWETYNSIIREQLPTVFYGLVDPNAYLSTGQDSKWDAGSDIGETAAITSATNKFQIESRYRNDTLQGYYLGRAVRALDGACAGMTRYVDNSYLENGQITLDLQSAFPSAITPGTRLAIVRTLSRDGVHPSIAGGELAARSIIDRASWFY